ncbi:alpha/beta hydrolase [Candidatus Woesearchaeota archaeon]|nr:alpha/beta hydrolase [Candidatus Woesearchaeota archaeon]
MMLNSFDGTPLYYEVKRNPSAFIVFLHGLGRDTRFWHHESQLFQNLGFSTLIPDLRGHGHSGKPTKLDAYKMKNFVLDIDRILRKEGVRKAHFIGHSMGAIVALYYYKLFSDRVKSIIVVNPDIKVPLRLRLLPNIKPLLRIAKKFDHGRRELIDFFLTERAGYCIRNLAKFAHDDKKARIRLFQNVKVPTLYIRSGNDRVIPRRDFERSFRLLSGADLFKIEKARHDVFLRSPREAGQAIVRFFLDRHLVSPLQVSAALALVLLSLSIGLFSQPGLFSILMQGGQGGMTGAAIVGSDGINTALGSAVAASIFAAMLLFSVSLLVAKRLKAKGSS